MNIISILCSRILIVCSTILACLVEPARAAGHTDTMKEYRFPIQGYELSFSVPQKFMSDYRGGPAENGSVFVKGRPGEGNSVIYFRQIHMFTGPFWVGDYGAIDFVVRVMEVDMAYNGQVSSLEQLEDYQKWQLNLPNRYGNYSYSKNTLYGRTWLTMTLIRNDAARTNSGGEENTILCFPLDERHFIQMGCRISEFVPNKVDRWLSDAYAMRDLIFNSIALREVNHARRLDDQHAK